jgi:hypothetical protein
MIYGLVIDYALISFYTLVNSNDFSHIPIKQVGRDSARNFVNLCSRIISEWCKGTDITTTAQT